MGNTTVNTMTNGGNSQKSGVARSSTAFERGRHAVEPQNSPRLSDKRKRPARIAAVVALACCMVLGGVYAAYATTFADPKYAWYLNNQDATEYTLTEPAQLYALSHLVNGTATVSGQTLAPVSFEGKTIKLANGMSLNIAGTAYEFTPIGTEEHPFSGVFDGQGSSISGLQVTETTSDAGLFGYVAESGAIENVTVNGEVSFVTDETVQNVGGIVGLCLGSVSNCTSNVAMSVESTFAPTLDTPTPTKNIGGVAGRVNGAITGSTYQATLTMNNDKDAVVDSTDNAVPVAMNVGGVVGLFGDDTLSTELRAAGQIEGCANTGKVSLSFTGDGGVDRFGEQVISKPACVGGIVGYSDGSIVNCSNTGEIRTSSPGDDGKYGYGTTYNNGASQCGGIVGNLRNVVQGNRMSSTLTPDSGTADDVLTVQSCYNTGLIIAANQAGGIVGTAGTYTVITECANGNYLENNKLDGTFADSSKGAVITTRWNKPFAGGIVGNTNGDVTFCSNRAQVNNTQAGYYLAGIAGGLGEEKLDTLGTIKNDPNYKPEMYGCYNTGQIGLGHILSYRFGALVGSNEGYVHDCVIKKGCVLGSTTGTDPSTGGSSTAVGDASWGDYNNLHVMTTDEMKSSDGLAQINAWCMKANGFQVYWYAADGQDGRTKLNDTYPVLNAWAEPTGATDISLADPQLVEADYASYTAVGTPVPAVSMSSAQVNGGILYQNVDFVVIPEEGATAISEGSDNPTPYTFSIRGIGKYSGTLSNAEWKYGIGSGSLSEATVQVDAKKYNWEVQFPSGVHVYDAAGGEIDSSSYSFVVYDSNTYDLRNDASPKYVVFDSAGTIQFLNEAGESDGDPVPALGTDIAGRSFKVYDRQGRLISDSDAKVYDPLTGKDVTKTEVPVVTSSGKSTTVTVGQSCELYKGKNEGSSNDGPAGYVVQVIGSAAYAGSTTTGQFELKNADLMQDCKYQQITYTDDEGEESTWKVNDNLKAYPSDGDPAEPGMQIEFTGATIKPEVALSYLGKTLELNDYVSNADGSTLYYRYGDYGYVYGPLDTGKQTSSADKPNRNVADGGFVTVRSGWLWKSSFTNYVCFAFDITPADISDCEVAPASQAYTGSPVSGLVQVKLHGNTLIEGQDYTVSYVNKDTGEPAAADGMVEKGTYVATVTPKDNLVGSARTIEVQIADPSTFSVANMSDITWTGVDIYPKDYLDITDTATGEQLEYGRDYSYTLTCVSRSIKNGTTTDTDVFLSKNKLDFVPYSYPYVKQSDTNYYVYTAHITGEGLYSGMSADRSFSILPLNISQTNPADWKIEGAEGISAVWGYFNTGSVYSQVDENIYRKITYKGIVLSESTWASSVEAPFLAFSVEDREGKKVGDQLTRISIEGGGVTNIGSIYLALDVPVTIGPADIAQVSVGVTSANLVYDGTAQKPITMGNSYAEGEGGDYLVDYSGNVNAGTATYVVRGVNKFTGSVSGSFAIAPQNLSVCTVTGGSSLVVKNAQGATMVEGADYTVQYAAGPNDETQIAYITGMGNYTGTKSVTVDKPTEPVGSLSVDDVPGQLVEAVTTDAVRKDLVARADGLGFTDRELADAMASVKGYSGYCPEDWPAGAEPALTVRDGDEVLSEGTDYTVSYGDNANLGTARATVTGIGAYAGLSVEKEFQVTGYIWYALTVDKDTKTGEPFMAPTFPSGTTYGQAVVNKFGTSAGSEYIKGNVIDGYGKGALESNLQVSYAADVETTDPVVPNSQNVKDKDGAWPPASEVSVTWTGDGQTVAEGTGHMSVNANELWTTYETLSNPLSALAVDGVPTVAQKYLYTGSVQDVDLGGVGASSRVKAKSMTDSSIASFVFGGTGGFADPAFYALSAVGDKANAGTQGVSVSFTQAWLDRLAEGGDLGGRVVLPDYFVNSATAAAAYIAPYDISDATIYNTRFSKTNFHGEFRNGLETAEAANDGAPATGSPVEAQLDLVDRFGNALVEGTDYTVSYKDAQGSALEGAPVEPGDYTAVVSGTVTSVGTSVGNVLAGSGNYTGTKEVPFTVAAVNLASATAAAIPDQVWTGQAIEPVPSLTYEGSVLSKDVDYEIASYEGNTNLGKATITVTGKGRFTGTLQIAFNIVKDARYDMSRASAAANDVLYTGASVADAVSVEVRDSSGLVLDKTAYTVRFERKDTDAHGTVTWAAISDDKVVNAGAYRALIKGAGSSEDPTGYTGTVYAEFSITAADFRVKAVASEVYDREKHHPSPVVTGIDESVPLAEGSDYTVAYLDADKNVIDSFEGYVNAGAYWMRVTGKGNYAGTFDVSFVIARADIAGNPMSAQAKGSYTGAAVEADVAVTGLVMGTDYQIAGYASNAAVGYATVTVKGIGNYTGEQTLSFKVQGDLSLASVAAIGDQEYTGGAIMPLAEVSFAGRALVEGTDYAVSYQGNVQPGTATVIVAGLGDWYKGSTAKTFVITAPTRTDDQTGVKASGTVFVDQATEGARVDLVVNPLDPSSESLSTLLSAYMDGDFEKVFGFEVLLNRVELNGDESVLRDGFGSLELSFPVGSEYDGRTALILIRHTDDVGNVSVERRMVTVVNGMVALTVDKLSEFLIAFDKSSDNDQGSGGGGHGGETGADASTSGLKTLAPTGDSPLPLAEGIAGVALGLGAMLIAGRKRRV